MSSATSNEVVSLFEILFAVKRAPFFFISIFIICMVLMAGVYLILPRQYYSEGKFYVQVGRSSVGTDPTTTSGTISIQDSRETEVKSVVEILRSRDLAERVVDRVGVERILEPNSAIGRFLETLPPLNLGIESNIDGDDEMTKEQFEALREREEAVNLVMDELDLDHPKMTTVISVSIKAQSPSLAREIVDTYLEEYKKKHVEINSGNAGGFFEDEFKKQNEALQVSERAQQEFRDKLKALSIHGARALQQRQLDQLKLDRTETIVQLSQQNEKAIRLAQQLVEIPRFIEGVDTEVSSLASDKAREAFFQLQIEESEASARYKEDNPKLQMIREKVRKASEEMAAIPETFMQVEKNVSAANQEMLVMLSDARASAAALSKRLSRTDALIAAAEERATKLNEAVIKGSELEREVQINRQSLMKIADKRAETNTIGALDTLRISNVAVAQPASLQLKKAFPSGMTFAILGTGLSFFISFALTFFKEASFVLERRRENTGSPSNSVAPSPEVSHGSFARARSTR